MDSANFVAMWSVNGQDSWNFFKNDFTTHIGAAGLELVPLALKFSEATNYVQQVGLSDMAAFSEDGTPAAATLMPFMLRSGWRENERAKIQENLKYDKLINFHSVYCHCLRFKPSGEVSFPDEYVNDWLEDLMSVPVGTVLYSIWAMDKPEELGGVETHIADLVLTSELTTTNWGDKHMFFRHQDMAEDVEMFPEWEEYLEKFGIPGDSGCPVARMMRYKG